MAPPPRPSPAGSPVKLAADFRALIPHLQLDPNGEAALADCASSTDALVRLETAGLLIEATRLAAHALSPRESVWWACMCSRHTASSGTDPAAETTLREAAEEWVRKQTDAQRRLAFEKAQKLGFGSPEAWCAVAAFWSGDSMSPIEAPKVPPEPHFYGLASAGSVALSAARGDARRRDGRLKLFLGSARDIAQGGAGRLDAEPA